MIMVHGMFIENGLSDWQIIQQENGFASVSFSGTWILIRDAVKQGIEFVQPKIRVYREDDNTVVVDWVDADFTKEEDAYRGEWSVTVDIPAGGLYRVETGLYAKCVREGLDWIFRGDACLHIGVGDLFLIAGQSNSAGYAKDMAFDPPMPGVHLYRNRGSWDIASHPMNEATLAADAANAERGNPGVSPWLSFGKKFLKYSGYPVGLIQTAQGGLSIRKWESDSSPMYVNMLNRAKAQKKIAGVLWYQGCSDTYIDNCELYKERYYSLIERFRKALGYEVPFFTFQINRQVNGEHDPGWGMVREVQRLAAHDMEKVYVLPTTAEKLCDDIHNCAHSCVHLGENMAKLCAHVLYKKEAFFAPEICEAVYEDDVLTMRFQNVSGRICAQAVDAQKCGFTVEDETGIMEFDEIKMDYDQPDTVRINLNRAPIGFMYVSFAWEANPTMTPPFDNKTYLPILSFYKYKVTKRNI